MFSTAFTTVCFSSSVSSASFPYIISITVCVSEFISSGSVSILVNASPIIPTDVAGSSGITFCISSGSVILFPIPSSNLLALLEICFASFTFPIFASTFVEVLFLDFEPELMLELPELEPALALLVPELVLPLIPATDALPAIELLTSLALDSAVSKLSILSFIQVTKSLTLFKLDSTPSIISLVPILTLSNIFISSFAPSNPGNIISTFSAFFKFVLQSFNFCLHCFK